jgi:hypothetical protein
VRNVSIATFNKNNAAMKTADKRVIANAPSIAMDAGTNRGAWIGSSLVGSNEDLAA